VAGLVGLLPRWDAVTAMRAMEEFTRSVGGYHFLYADTFLSRWVWTPYQATCHHQGGVWGDV